MEKLYHFYNEETLEVSAGYFENAPKSTINHSVNGQIRPIYDIENDCIVEGATQEEIAEANKAKVPESISQMKLRKQLILSGISIASIDALIQSLPQPNRDLIYTMWEYAVVFDRNNAELNQMANALGISQEQLDEIFINGNLL